MYSIIKPNNLFRMQIFPKRNNSSFQDKRINNENLSKRQKIFRQRLKTNNNCFEFNQCKPKKD